MKINFESPFALMQRIIAVALFIVFFMASGCGKQQSAGDGDEPLTSLKGTSWKLEGMVDKLTGESRRLAPFDCEACYTLAFNTDSTATVINILSRSRLDLRVLGPPPLWVWDKMLMCESYDKDGEMYCKDYDKFLRSIFSIDSFSATNNELRLFVNAFPPTYYLSFVPHKGASAATSLRGSNWKLEGYVDIKTGEIKELKPKDMYQLGFIGDSKFYFSFRTIAFGNAILDIKHLDLIRNPFKTWPFDKYESSYMTTEWFDDFKESFLFLNGIEKFDSYEISPDEFKFFFFENGKKYYLSFKNII